eukprot:GFUD01109798.1.p1 GENE.GFUD01109798.1~~GFUD01109798.1.p1  ORF type:complete len:324 (+),score=72.69 GFUD01109798.1:85-1056(+)
MLLVRNMPRLLKQFVPPLIGFLLGYMWRVLDSSPLETTSNLENDLPLFTGPSSTLLVLVISSPSNSLLRNTIRETWLSVSKKNHNFKAFFVIGERSLNSKQVYDLSQEKVRHDDLLLLPMHDSYGTLTSKVLKSFEFSQKNFKFDYLLKCDDDTFVDIEKIVDELEQQNERTLYWGFFDGRAPVQTKGKWADPQYRLCDKYIPYALGGGYVLGRSLVQYMADNSRMLELFNSEDASVGTWLAGLKVKRKHDSRFDTEWKSRGCSNQFVVTHKQTQADMKIKWKRLAKYGSICEGAETKVRLSYNYDWSKPPSECCIRSDHSLP